MKSSFQAGVDTLYNKCKSCGSTPSSKTPTAISNSIQSIYTNRYNSGYNSGYSNGKASSGSGGNCVVYQGKISSANSIIPVVTYKGSGFSVSSNKINFSKSATVHVYGSCGATNGAHTFTFYVNKNGSNLTKMSNTYTIYNSSTSVSVSSGDTLYIITGPKVDITCLCTIVFVF